MTDQELEGERPITTTPKPLAITLWPVSICHRTSGTPEKGVLKVDLLSISTRERHPAAIWLPEMPYLFCSQAMLVQVPLANASVRPKKASLCVAHSLRWVGSRGTL